MLPVLIIGSWFSILAYLNELTLLGLGKPSYNAASNGLKFAFLLIGLPLSFNLYRAYWLLSSFVVLADLCPIYSDLHRPEAGALLIRYAGLVVYACCVFAYRALGMDAMEFGIWNLDSVVAYLYEISLIITHVPTGRNLMDMIFQGRSTRGKRVGDPT